MDNQTELSEMVVARFNEETSEHWSARVMKSAISGPEHVIEVNIRWQYGVVPEAGDLGDVTDADHLAYIVDDGWIKLLTQVLTSLDGAAEHVVDYLAEQVAAEIEVELMAGEPENLSNIADMIRAMLGTEETLKEE